ncbi:alpha beta-hydrolase [Crepidotus variabilis]|uniref:Alpha beta-hydrolase n=1 Tax=Crepidotus variabilis TaxID=179855 RepID=A0A9P6JWI7_9AGAR|nr:alpha beta-hydrolase [Crepidotus variabilis]
MAFTPTIAAGSLLFAVIALFLFQPDLNDILGLLERRSGVTTGFTLHNRTSFCMGGEYASNQPGIEVMSGQMYVERLTPEVVHQKLPILMIHGFGMTGNNFLTTPDGRPGWADYFMAQGYEVYLVDQPSRGRSAWQNDLDGKQVILDTLYVEQRFTATQQYGLWPQATLLTQWPGNGSRGDPTFDNFYASMVPSLSSQVETSFKFRAAGALLLDRIGVRDPCILLTHSQSGQFGWILADARPKLVKSIIAIEPIGPPFISAIFPPFYAARPYGLTEIPVSFSPPIIQPEDLEPQAVHSQPNFTCIQQLAPARQLVNLAKVPVLLITSESGYHAVYDGCSVEFLRSAGVSVEHIRLEQFGFHGNGHMMFMEKNSLDIARWVVKPWLQKLR